MSISRGRDRGRFPLRQGGADAVGWSPNKEATKSAGSRLERRERGGPTGRGAGAPSTTPHEGKSARSRRVGRALCSSATIVFGRAGGSVRWGVCGVARLVRSTTTAGAVRLASAPVHGSNGVGQAQLHRTDIRPCQRGSRAILRQAPETGA